MNWNSVGEFIHMGGYGLYVWGSFLMVAAVMVLEVLQLRSRARTLDGAKALLQDGEQQ